MVIRFSLYRHTIKNAPRAALLLLLASLFISQTGMAQTTYVCYGVGRYNSEGVAPGEPDNGYIYSSWDEAAQAAGDPQVPPWVRTSRNYVNATDGVSIEYSAQNVWPNGFVQPGLISAARLFTKWDCRCPVSLNAQGKCPVIPGKAAPPSCGNAGQGENPGTPYPITLNNGNKYLTETDIGSPFISFNRLYNSAQVTNFSSLGKVWRHNYSAILLPSDDKLTVSYYAPSGRMEVFKKSNGAWYSDADISDRLSDRLDTNGVVIGWNYYVAATEGTESFDLNGKLVSIQSRSGIVQALSYSDGTNGSTSGNGGFALDANGNPTTTALPAGLLLQVKDNLGHVLKFGYNASSRLVKVTAPDNTTIQYGFDGSGNLTWVTYPDTSTRKYLYNELTYTGGASLPHALTGIVDENNIRYVTYTYDAQGRAVGEVFPAAGTNTNHYSLSFNPTTATTSVTDPIGATRSYSFQVVLGMLKRTGLSQPGGSGCGAASSNLTYDANGNIASSTDFNGNVTTYTYDLTRNLETSRTEAAGTPQARTITTAWHPTYRLPLKIAAPKRRTTFTHDANGNVLTKTVQATTDATGTQAFSSTLTGVADKWTTTYNAVGQVLTIDGPRTDATDKITYAYDASGNLVTITNAAGHVTTLSNYDAHGHAGRIVDPNGIATNLTYHPRGWLASSTVTDGTAIETTSYAYDGVGQLIGVTLPKGAKILYTYDDAHRLTAIADSLGNKITYTLDAMGNRINEQVKDPGGALARQTSRLYDALNRLQQVTGGAQ